MSNDRSDNPKVEFAKSGRSKCRGCQEIITKATPRIGVPSPFTTPKGEVITSYRYYHVGCTPRYIVQDIISFLTKENLEDSDLQKDTLASLNQILKKEPLKETRSEQQTEKSFLEYAKSSRGKCRECEEKIEKDTVRVAEPTLVELDDGRKFTSKKYFHLNCHLTNVNDPKSELTILIEVSLEKKTIQEEQALQIKQKYADLDEKAMGVDEILAGIGSEAINFSVLRSIAKEKGVQFELIEKAIDRGLMRGEYFKPTSDTVQKLV
ncbi:MAG: PARP-type zinc finger-containing protein [Candidatus Hodarchaeales archaeon]|jgi:hypothetical protein